LHQCPLPARVSLPDAWLRPQTNTRAEIRDPSPPRVSCTLEFQNCARSNQNAAPQPYTPDSNPSRRASPCERGTSRPDSQSCVSAKSLRHEPHSSECNQSTVPELIAGNRKSC